MEPSLVLLAAAVGYFVGAISFTRVVAHFVAPAADFSRTTYAAGDGQTLSVTSVNATSLALRAGPKAGMLAGLLDVFKIFIPTLAFRLWCPDPPYYLIVAAAGMAGHVWPVYYRFRGGRGISQVYGGMLAIDPLGALVCAIAGPIIGMLLRDTYITFAGGMLLLIPWLWFTTHDWRFVGLGDHRQPDLHRGEHARHPRIPADPSFRQFRCRRSRKRWARLRWARACTGWGEKCAFCRLRNLRRSPRKRERSPTRREERSGSGSPRASGGAGDWRSKTRVLAPLVFTGSTVRA